MEYGIEDIAPTKEKPVQRQSIGDAIIVIALLIFICAWTIALTYTFAAGTTEGEIREAGSFVVLVIVILIAGPPLWAGRLIRHIITRD